MPSYPGEIYEPREIENRPEREYDPTDKLSFFAEDLNNTNNEIVAIETELGTNPKGIYDSVKENLEAIWEAIAGFATSFLELTDTPASYEGQGGKFVKVKATVDGLEFGEAVAGPHAATHQDGGDDEINVAALSGELADEQKSAWAKVSGKPATFPPEAHKISHQNDGADEISIAGLSGEAADEQKSNFLKLTDTPASYAGQGGKFVKVKATADGLEFGEAAAVEQDSRFEARRTTNQALAASAWTQLKFTSELYDNLNEHDNITYFDFMPKTPGRYLINVRAIITGATVLGGYIIELRVNGESVGYLDKENTNTGACYLNIIAILTLAADQYVEVWAFIPAGTTSPTFVGSNNFFQGHKL